MAKKTETPPDKKPIDTGIFDGLGLTEMQVAFVIMYCADYSFNATRAYLDVNGLDPVDDYSVASTLASRLLKKVEVREAVRRQMEHQLRDKDALAKRIIDEHAKIAFAHSSMVMDGVNSFGYVVKDFKDIPEQYHAAISGFKKTDTGLLEIKFYDKQKSLDSLARILGMFDDGASKIGEKYEDLITRMRRAKGE